MKAKLDYLKVHALSVFPAHSLEAFISDSYRENSIADTSRNYWGLVHKLSFEYGGRETSIVKFFEVKDSAQTGFKVMQFQNNNGWQRVNVKELQDITDAIKYLKSSAFWEFYNKKNSDHAVINELRQKIKSEKGVVDIDKLGEVVRANRGRLKEFCDM